MCVNAPRNVVELELAGHDTLLRIEREEMETLDLRCFSTAQTLEDPVPDDLVATGWRDVECLDYGDRGCKVEGGDD